MSITLEQVLGKSIPNGVYRLRSRASHAGMGRAAARRGWHVVALEGQTVVSKAAFLQVIAQGFQFPAYFGQNWDAFEESINDLDWLSAAGYILLIDDVNRFAHAQPEEWATARAILAAAAAQWQAQGTPFYVLLR